MQQSRSIKNLSKAVRDFSNQKLSLYKANGKEKITSNTKKFLEVVSMGLEDNGLSYTMEMISKNEDDFLEVGVSILLVHQPSEEWIKTPDFTLPIAEFFKEEDPAKTCVDLCLTITLATVLNLKL